MIICYGEQNKRRDETIRHNKQALKEIDKDKLGLKGLLRDDFWNGSTMDQSITNGGLLVSYVDWSGSYL